MNEEQMIRFLEGDVPEVEARTIRERLQREPAFRARLDRLRSLRQVLEAGTPDAFAPYFSERVLRRLSPTHETGAAESFYGSLRWVFARAAVASVVVAGALGTYNVLDYRVLGVAASVVEALFGLPSASLADALSYSAW